MKLLHRVWGEEVEEGLREREEKEEGVRGGGRGEREGGEGGGSKRWRREEGREVRRGRREREEGELEEAGHLADEVMKPCSLTPPVLSPYWSS